MIHRPDSTLQVLKLYILYRYVYNIYIYMILFDQLCIWLIWHDYINDISIQDMWTPQIVTLSPLCWHPSNGQSSCFSIGLETDHFSTRSPASQGWVGWSPSWCQRVSWAKLLGPLGPLGLGLRWTLRVKAAPYHRKFWGSMTMHFEGEVVDFNLPTFLLDWSGCMHVYAACWACTFAKQ